LRRSDQDSLISAAERNKDLSSVGEALPSDHSMVQGGLRLYIYTKQTSSKNPCDFPSSSPVILGAVVSRLQAIVCRPSSLDRKSSSHLAQSTARHTLALGALLTASDGNTRPLPAGTRSAEDVDLLGFATNGTSDTIDSQVSNWDTRGGRAGRAAVLVVLLDHDAVLIDRGELDVGVGHVLDGASRAGDRLNPDA